MADIELRSVEKWFDATQVVKGVDLAIEAGEFIIFVGPSGCGKSTLLRMIAGLEEISRGTVWVAGRDATAEPPSKRGLAMVFQSYALYPHMSVAQNLGFALKLRKTPRDEIDRRGLKTVVEADGGIRRHTVPQIARAGADYIVPGSLMFKEDPSAMREWLAGLG